MTTSPYVCSAAPGFEIAYLAVHDEIRTTPIVAWELSGLKAVPLALFPITTAVAVIFPDGQAVELDTGDTWADVVSWRKNFDAEAHKIRSSVRAVTVTPRGVEVIKDQPPAASIPLDGDYSAIRDLGLSGRACAPMERVGIVTVADLADWTRAEVLAIKGVPTNAGPILDAALVKHGLSWKGSPVKTTAPAAETEEEDDDVEDMI